MAQGQGSSVSLRVGTEPSFGVNADEMAEVPFIPSLTLKETQNQNESAVIRGTRDTGEPFLGYRQAESSFSIPLDTKLSGFWFKKALGQVASVDDGDGNYTHTFTKNDTSLESMTIEKAHKDIGTYHLGNGFKVNTFNISFGGEDEAKLDLEFLGQKVSLNTSELVAPSTGGEGAYFEPFQCTVTGASNVKNASISFTNNLDGDQYVIGDGGTRGEIPLGMIAVSGSFTALYENDDLLATAKASTTNAMSMKFEIDATKSVEFKLGELKLEPTGIEVGSPAGLEQTFNFKAFWKSGADNSALAVVLKNQVASY